MFYSCKVSKLMGKETNKQTNYIYSFYHVKVYETVPMTWDLECCDC